MLQRTSMTTLSATADVVDAWHSPVPDTWIDTVRQTLRLPTTWREYLAFLLILVLIGSAAALQVALSVQIMQATVTLQELEGEILRIERDNAELVWQIGQNIGLDDVQRRARRLGYVPVEATRYVVQDSTPAAPTAGTSGADALPGEAAIPFLDLARPAAIAQLSESSRVRTIPARIGDGWHRAQVGFGNWQRSIRATFQERAGGAGRLLSGS